MNQDLTAQGVGFQLDFIVPGGWCFELFTKGVGNSQ